MFWRRNRREDSDPPEPPESEGTETSPENAEPMEIERNAPRPPTILQVAGHYEGQGARIIELFKEIQSPRGQTVLPIYLENESGETFVEVETGPWSDEAVDAALKAVAVLRSSEHADTEVEILSAYPVPADVMFFYSRAPAALFQLALLDGDVEHPEEFAETFRRAAAENWGIDLDYEVETLPLIEELLMAALNDKPEESSADASVEDAPVEDAPVLQELVHGLGCYVGEVIRHNAPEAGNWIPASDWSDEAAVLEVAHFDLDPLGKARAFILEGPEDSTAFYAEYVLRELRETDENDSEPE